MMWRSSHPGGVITCDAPGCRCTRRNYCSPGERDCWSAHQAGNVIVDLCPQHREEGA